MFKKMLAIFLVILAAYLEFLHIFSVGGINPNLGGVSLVMLFLSGADLFVISLAFIVVNLILVSVPFPFLEISALALALFSVIFLRRSMSYTAIASVPIFTAIFTSITYLILGPVFMYEHTYIFLAELGYNILAGYVLFGFLRLIYGEKS